jgi:hypothetical protein
LEDCSSERAYRLLGSPSIAFLLHRHMGWIIKALAAALAQANNPTLRTCAPELGRLIHAEDGIAGKPSA